MTQPKVLVIITARGGSKGIPRKNLREIAGRPLIDYAIKAALGAREHIYKVIVSTDDEEIAEVSRACGAEVPFMRPKELATDQATSLPVVQHAVQTIEEQDGVTIDWSMLIQPTNPMVTTQDIIQAINLVDEQATSIVSVIDAINSHPLKALKIEDGHLKPYIDDAPQAIRRQDLRPVYRRNGSIYMTRRNTLIDNNDLYGSHITPCVLHKEQSIDIDTESNLKFAEFLLQEQQTSKQI